jgi:hypothetical protein
MANQKISEKMVLETDLEHWKVIENELNLY